VVNGIPVHAGIHLHLMGDGKWATAFRGEVHVTRRGMPGCGVTQKAEDAVRDAVAGAWTAHAASAPGVLSEAREHDRREREERIRAELDELRQKLMGKWLELQELLGGEGVTTKDGLLWRGGKVIPLPEADQVARENGYQHAEQMVAALAKVKA